jgi:hypothetical protein
VDEMMITDPYAYAALALYLVTAGGIGLALVMAKVMGRKSAYQALEAAIQQARQIGKAAFAPLPGGKFLVYAKGTAGEVGEGTFALSEVGRTALVKDMDGQTGIVISSGGKDHCVTGLGPMARMYSRLQADEANVQPVFRDDEGTSMQVKIGALDAQEHQILGQWLMEDGEIITDIINDVDYEGSVASAGSKGTAKLVVTNLRAGLLAQTVETESVAGGTRTTTHYNLIQYLLPLADRVKITRKKSLISPEYLVELELPPEDAAKVGSAPILKLTEDHAGIFLPIVVFRRPVVYEDQAVNMGSLLPETMWGLGWSILFLIPGGIVTALLSESNVLMRGGSYNYRYSIPLLLGFLLTPLLFRALGLIGNISDRSQDQALVASL